MFKAPTTNIKRELVPKGTHVARLYSMVDLGIQESEWKGEKKESHKIYLTFELPNEKRMFDVQEKPMVIGKKYTFSMGSKSNLRPVVEALIGTTLTDSEAANFDFEGNVLVGRPCMVSVSHNTSTNNMQYANLESVVPMVKGMECPPQFNENVLYKIEDGDSDTFRNLPNFLREIIMACKNDEKLTGKDAEMVKSLREGTKYTDNSISKLEEEIYSQDDTKYPTVEEDMTW